MQKEQEKQEERRRQEYENLKQRKEKNQVLKQELELKKQQECALDLFLFFLVRVLLNSVWDRSAEDG